MKSAIDPQLFEELSKELHGEFYHDKLMKVLYATDASVYKEMPLAVAIPKDQHDLQALISFVDQHQLSIIPRAAGTSLAGQVVGDGIIVDISKFFNKIIEYNKEESWVRVQPGVVRDQLNDYLRPHGKFFSPITSTANRATIGGMVGNNSSGTTSITYGSTRDHILELKTILSNGSEVLFKSLTSDEIDKKVKLDSLEGKIYRFFEKTLKDPEVQESVRKEFPKASIHRRNTGYALDILLNSVPYTENSHAFNIAQLLCGSEGTLAFTTEIKIHVDDLPPPEVLVVAAHFEDLQSSLEATKVAMKYSPSACELMDKIILDCTLQNAEQRKNRFFVEGDPAAILTIEFRADTKKELHKIAQDFISALQTKNLGFSYPIIEGEKTKKVWKLRSAGLGLLANIPGDKKAVACIEDTAVDVQDLPEYIEEFTEIMTTFNQESVYYAHAGAGELHLRPILDLKKPEDVKAFYDISLASAKLVKKFHGSLSGEHGDGRLRAGFIPLMVGEKNYAVFQDLKNAWDPKNIFNPGKIVDAPPMNESLRYKPSQKTKTFNTLINFDDSGGIMRAAEKCNGSGDCRKSSTAGGTMCPSFQASQNEKDTTRARANALRDFLTNSDKKNAFDHQELKEVMDLCLSCKACKTECPSNVDMSALKAEFQYQYHKSNGVPLRSKAFSKLATINHFASKFPTLANFLFTNKFVSSLAKKVLGISTQRSLPKLSQQTLRKWYAKQYHKYQPVNPISELYLFCDEFTNYNEAEIGIKTIQLLTQLGYAVELIEHDESGRAALSKGLLEKAKKHANTNVSIFADLVTEAKPLIGIEPSAILGFRDEYIRIVDHELEQKAKNLAINTFLIDEFLSHEIQKGNITPKSFTKEAKKVLFHGHCHQKALSEVDHSLWILSLPENYTVENILSGCCGMAGSFGYEKEHYETSQQVAELVLFPAIRSTDKHVLLSAPGTSCRHQIKDEFQRKVQHPVEILHDALITS